MPAKPSFGMTITKTIRPVFVCDIDQTVVTSLTAAEGMGAPVLKIKVWPMASQIHSCCL